MDRHYLPAPDDTLNTLFDKAFACGRDLHPDDRRAKWIDTHPSRQEREALISQYHTGQSEQFEQGAW